MLAAEFAFSYMSVVLFALRTHTAIWRRLFGAGGAHTHVLLVLQPVIAYHVEPL
jgi:hypothetical protein